MFSFFKKRRSQFNEVELNNVILKKSENIYHNENVKKVKEKNYGINTIVKNVPLEIGTNGKLLAKVRYVGIPNIVVYFILNISNIQEEYVSRNKTIDIHINAIISGDTCKEYKFSLLPFYSQQGGALACV